MLLCAGPSTQVFHIVRVPSAKDQQFKDFDHIWGTILILILAMTHIGCEILGDLPVFFISNMAIRIIPTTERLMRIKLRHIKHNKNYKVFFLLLYGIESTVKLSKALHFFF